MLADNRVRRVGETELLETGAPGFLWQIGDLGEREKTVQNHLFKRSTVQRGGEGFGEQARPSRRDRDRDLVERQVGEQTDLGIGSSMDERQQLPRIDRLAGYFQLSAVGTVECETHL